MRQFVPIVPAIIPTSLASLQESIKQLQGIPELHLDMLDGVFVPTISWPYTPSGVPAELFGDLEKFSLEVDLMVSEPLKASEEWLKAGVDMLVFHIETIAVEELRDFAKQTAVSVGVCALLDTPKEKLLPYLEFADYVQVMGIARIGVQGEPLDERAFALIEWLKEIYPHLPISIDGSVNKDTLPKIALYKPNRYIVGSAIMKQPNPQLAYDELVKLLQ